MILPSSRTSLTASDQWLILIDLVPDAIHCRTPEGPQRRGTEAKCPCSWRRPSVDPLTAWRNL